MLENFSGSSADVERMLENNKKALEIFTRLHDDYAATVTLNNLTNLSRGEAAKSFSQRALRIARKHNGTRDIAWALMRLGVLEMIYGDPAKAGEYLSESNARYTTIQYSGGMAYSAQYLGILAYRQSLYPLAQQYFEQALLISNRAGWISDTLLSKQLLGAVAFSTREYELARDRFLETTEIALKFTGDDLPDWLILPELARLLETLGNPRLAVISIVSTIRDLQANSAELWKVELEEVLDDFKSQYAKAELTIWIEKGQQINPIELVSAIRDALSGE